MESAIISSENVKPSSPTPQNLRTYKFSMIDQSSPSVLVPFILYFPNTTQKIDPNLFISQTSHQLKQSLSTILTRFYPLAGRINSDGQSIDCNDEGVPFVVAKFTGHNLSDLLRYPQQNSFHYLLPCQITFNADYGSDITVIVQIQLNYFDCRGVAIGVVFHHKAGDAVTMAAFLRSWAGVTRAGPKQPVCPNYILQSIFPQIEGLPKQNYSLQNILKSEKSFMRRFVFDANAISSLKSKSGVERPTRVEAVSSLIWKCFMAASIANNNSVSVAIHSVNLRRRAKPPFSSDCFGNFVRLAAASSSNESGNGLGELVRKMREAVNKIDGDFVNRMHGDGGVSGDRENHQLIWSGIFSGGGDMLLFNSWCGLGFCGADFGWGNPIWVAKCDVGVGPESGVLNTVWLMDSGNGDGIEAWVVLGEKYMSVFENVAELRALASVDPCPIDITTTIGCDGLA